MKQICKKIAVEVMRYRSFRKEGVWNQVVDELADIYCLEKHENIMDLLMSVYEAGRITGIRDERAKHNKKANIPTIRK